ncbi:MAG TPA: UDP-N-acetylglucosamine 1-carboxyvinyltransferase [Acidimicrobiales bacterium]|nr:UDP-N-acetylglucosamine 1-carboxyvinyltransferase [Acidimicrobiales bacterium]
MGRLVVRPSGPLSGTVRVSGAKNSVLKLMAATTLCEGTFTLHDVPHIVDVEIMCDLLVSMGLDTKRNGTTLEIVRGPEVHPEAPYELVEQMRASIVVLGPLVARCGRARVSMPGGDNFGVRPIDMHLRGLELMGATVDTDHGYIEARCNGERLVGARIVLEFPSHTATDNLLMAAVLAKGTTVIENAAREPEVADLAAMLNRMGARVIGAGSSTIEVEGVDSLQPVEHTVIPDRIEAATWVAAAALAGGEVSIDGARPDHMDMIVQKMGDMGVRVAPSSQGLWAGSRGALRSADVATLPYPGIATDYKPLLVAMLAVADGVAIVTENIFRDNRFAYVAELNRMGADIRTDGHHAVVRGVRRLSGARVKAHDLRAGVALCLAGLVADGETVVEDAHHIDRGYDDFVGKLRSLGGDIERAR